MSAARRVRFAALAWLVGFGALRLTLWAPEVCPTLTSTGARQTAVEAGRWLVANQEGSGEFLYGWHRDDERPAQGYNLVRHAGVTMSLYQLAAAGEVDFLDAADRGLGWMLDRLEPAGDAVVFTEDDRAKLGSAALLAVSLSHRRLITGDRSHDDTMRALGRFMVGQQRADGSMLNFFDLDEGAPVPEETSLFSTGEAAWALAMLHEAFPDQGFDETALATLDYMATVRDEEEGFFPQPWPDQWAAYALAEMAEWGLADHHIEYARSLLARWALIVRFDAQRGTPYGSLTHGPAPRGGGHATWIEGLAALRPVTLTDPRLADAADATEEALACGAARLAERQVPSGDDRPPQVAGAWFYDDLTRMDDQQHAASGMLGAEPVLP